MRFVIHVMPAFAIAILLVKAAPFALADGSKALQNFTQICIEDQSVGFNWTNGGWELRQFIPEKTIVKKITPPESFEEARGKSTAMAHFDCVILGVKTASNTLDGHRSYPACIEFRKPGDERATYESCHEKHTLAENGQWVKKISCRRRNFYFEPNGWFHAGHIHSDLERNPENDYKDSLTVKVGKCGDTGN